VSAITTATASAPGDAFCHEAFFYAGQAEFVEGAGSFVRDALEAEESVLVVVNKDKVDGLRSDLGPDAEDVYFADMAEVGRNPARIIPAWRDFLAERPVANRGIRGIGEPIYPARGPAELLECQRHESLLNVAFADSPPWWLLCPYDTDSLGSAVIEEAYRSHPFVLRDGIHVESTHYRGLEASAAPLEAETPLPEPARHLDELDVDTDRLGVMRHLVSHHARRFGLSPGRTDDLVLAVNEIATNSLRHAENSGAFRLWRDGDALVCEVRDGGHIDLPLAGRQRPALDREGGRGLWLVQQLCDLVQIRSSSAGTVVRVHMSLTRD